ncbi:MAG: cupredoxin family copper-binding protein [Patescibacteria group bacterium]
MKKISILALLIGLVIILGGCNYAGQPYNTPAVNSPSPAINQNSNFPPATNLNKPVAVPPVVTPPPVNTPPVNVNKPKTSAIQIINFSFNPATLSIKVGDTVKWTNNEAVPHQIAGSGFGSSTLYNGETYSNTFSQAGIYDYYCSIHPSMTGEIIVTP